MMERHGWTIDPLARNRILEYLKNPPDSQTVKNIADELYIGGQYKYNNYFISVTENEKSLTKIITEEMLSPVIKKY